MRRTKRRLGRFAEPAHTARLYVGRNIPPERGGGRVSDAALQRIVDGTAGGIGGGATALPGRGVWVEPRRAPIRENTAVIDVVGSATDSCPKFIDRVRALAGRAAGIAKQTAVLAVTTCADGSVDGDLVDARGRSAYPLTTLPGDGPPRRFKKKRRGSKER